MSFAKWKDSKRLIVLRNKSDGKRFDLPETNIFWVSLSANVFIIETVQMVT
jgi:hypothetical protein